MYRLMTAFYCIFLLLLNGLNAGETADKGWNQFRGPHANGLIENAQLPLTWDETANIKWKIKLDGTGWSQPLVHDEKVYIYQAVGAGLKKPKEMNNAVTDISTMMPVLNKPLKTELAWELCCFNLRDGQLIWKQELTRQKPEVPIHVSNTHATETPVIDQNRIFVYSGITGKVFAYDLKGKKLWEQSLGTFSYESNFGPGSSPVCYKGNVLIQCDNEKESFVISLDQITGEERWRIKRSEKTSWSTPYIWQNVNGDQLIICGKENVTAYDPATQVKLWELNKIPSSFTASPVSSNQLLVLGNNGPFSDGPLFGITSQASGDITLKSGDKTNSFIQWSRKRSGPGFASPVLLDDLIYIVFSNKLFCYDSKTGEEIYKQRLPDGHAQVGCPITDGKHLYLFDESGISYVVSLGRTFKIEHTNRLNDIFWATPAATSNSLILRGTEYLYCVGDK